MAIYYASFVLLTAICIIVLTIFLRRKARVRNHERNNLLTANQRKLLYGLTLHGYEVKANYPCGRTVIDIAIPGHRIAIDCESKVIDFTTRRYNADPRKEPYLQNKGWIVLRFSGAMIQGNIGKVISKIEDAIMRAQAH